MSSAEQIIATLLSGGGGSHKQQKDYGVTLSEEVQIVRLEEYLDAYNKPPRFKVGEIITPKDDVCLRGAGNPHVVIDTRDRAEPNWRAAEGTLNHGTRCDIRVAFFADNDDIVAMWQESHMYRYHESND